MSYPMGGRQLLLQLADGSAPCKLAFKWVVGRRRSYKKKPKGSDADY